MSKKINSIAFTTGLIMMIANPAIAQIDSLKSTDSEINIPGNFENIDHNVSTDAIYSQTADQPNLTGVVWQLQKITYNNNELIEINQPENYTIEFLPDNQVQIKADCNRVIGTYTKQEQNIEIKLGASTLAMCHPESVSDQYLRDLANAKIFFFQDGNLYLDLYADTGTMMFQSASNLTSSVTTPTEDSNLENLDPETTTTAENEDITPAEESEPQTSDTEETYLAQQSQNPIADLISVPFQHNINFNVGPFEDTQYLLNFQPVIPAELNTNWLLVTRIIAPIINQPTVDINTTTGGISSGGSTFGLGDITPSFFFVPRTKSNVTWGVGPILLLPTATDEVLGTGKWGIGPSAVVVVTQGRWLYGALTNQVWSFAGDNDRSDVSLFLLQPFISYTFSNGWTVGTAPSITANWNANGDNKWTVPIGLSVSKLVMFGKQPVSLGLAGYYNVVRPDFASDWNLRITTTFLFPR